VPARTFEASSARRSGRDRERAFLIDKQCGISFQNTRIGDEGGTLRQWKALSSAGSQSSVASGTDLQADPSSWRWCPADRTRRYQGCNLSHCQHGHVSREMLEYHSHLRMAAKRAALDSNATRLPNLPSGKLPVIKGGVHGNGNQTGISPNAAAGKLLR